MTLNDFVKKNENKFLDFDGAYGAQCVDLYRIYVRDVLNLPQSPGVTGAADIWTSYLKDHYERISNTPDGVPVPGDIIIWNRNYGPFGHVAIVLSASLNSMVCFSQNDPTGQPCIKKTYTYKNIYGWLHPKKEQMADTIQVDKNVFENLVKKSTQLDEILTKYGVADQQALYNQLSGKDARITDLGNQLGTAQAEVNNRIEQVSRVEAQLLQSQKDLKAEQTKLKDALAQVDKFAKEKGTLAIQIEQLTIQVESLKAGSDQGSVTLTIGDIWKLIWNQKITITK